MKPEYQKILFCSDFSLDADNAFHTALDLAERYGPACTCFTSCRLRITYPTLGRPSGNPKG